MKHLKLFEEFLNENDQYVKLVNEIYDFLNKYAGINPSYEKGDDEYEKFTGPDPCQLLDCAKNMIAGHKPGRCWSEWGSGCYKPYMSTEGKAEHDRILAEINLLNKS